jgi:sarcosine oxidase subunit alpha
MSDRLPQSPSQVINRKKNLNFFYNGKKIKAYEGDTIASALWAEGIRHTYDSFKYHRPRGMMELGVHAVDPLMEVNGRLNTRIARTPVTEGMKVEGQSQKGLDLLKLSDLTGSVTQVGFYYKKASLYKSRKAWDKARDMMRKAPGNLGAIKPLAQRPKCEEINLTPELLVIGGGLAGLEAVKMAVETGVRVVLVEAEPWLGGYHAFQGVEYLSEIKDCLDKLYGYGNLTTLLNTTAAMAYPDGLFVCVEKCPPGGDFQERSYLVRPKCVIYATGAMDRPLVFEHNDRPGVILPQTAQRLIHLYGVQPGKKALLAGGDEQIYRTALDLAACGVSVEAVADIRKDAEPGPLMTQAKDQGITVWPGCSIKEVKGKKTINAALVSALDGTGEKNLKCDLVVAASGKTPLFKLVAQTDARISYHHDLGYHLAEKLPLGQATAGRINGLVYRADIKAQARQAVAEVFSHIGIELSVREEGKLSASPNPPQVRNLGDKKRRFICLGNDVTEKDLEQALAEGFDNLESIKRYTTATMGPEQGSLSQANFLDYLAYLDPENMGDQAVFTPRAPLMGVTLGVMAAGQHDQPRLPPTHHVQEVQGGKAFRAGPWIRVEHFGDPEAESMALHRGVCLLDASTLGKFRIFGPDAAKWLNRVNLRDVDALAPGKILLNGAVNSEGVLIDDGVFIQKGPEEYYFTTSSARAAFTKEWYERWRREESWQAHLVDVTECKAVLNLAGPKARDVLQSLTDADLSNQALPFMHWLNARVAEVDVLIMRMGFLGELSLELHCPAAQADHLWRSICRAGEPFELLQAGLETQFVGRLEKGHVIPGLDADGNTNLFEAGFDWLWDGKEAHVGGSILKLLAKEKRRSQCVGFFLEGRVEVTDGNLIVRGEARLGHITSVRYSPLLNRTIGLALVQPEEPFAPGDDIYIWLKEKEVKATVAGLPFYDSKGERMRL